MDDPPPKRKNTWKVVLWILIVLCVIVLGVVAFLPAYFSTASGKAKIVDWINRKISGTVSIHALHLTWFSGQQIDRFSLFDKKGNQIVNFDQLITDKGLLPILFKTNTWGNTKLQGLSIHLVNEGQGKLNLEESLEPKDEKKRSKKASLKKKPLQFSLPTQGEFALENGNIEIEGPKIAPITLSDLTLTFYGNKQKDASLFHIVGNSSEGGSKGEILLSGRISCCEPLVVDFSEGIIDGLEKMGPLYLMMRFNSFPVAIFDELLTYDDPKLTGIFVSAIGPTLNIQGEVNATRDDLQINTEISSLNLKGNIVGQTEESFFRINPESHLSLTVTPAFFEKLVHAIKADTKWHLGGTTEVTFDIEQLSFPLPLDKPLVNFAFIGAIDRALLSHEILGPVTLRNISLSGSSPGLGKEVSLQYAGEIQTPDAPSKFEGNILGTNLLNNQGDFSLKAATLQFSTSLSSIPLDALELALGESIDLTPYLGRSLSLFCKGYIEKGVGQVEAKITSSVLQTENIVLNFDPNLSLLNPVKITYRISPELLQEYLPHKKELRIPEGGLAIIDLKEFSLGYTEKTGWDFNTLKLDADIALASAKIQGISHLNPLLVKKVVGKLTVASLDKVNLLLKGDLGLSNREEYTTLLMGPECSFSFSSEGAIAFDAKTVPFTLSTMGFKLENEGFVFDLRGKMDDKGIFTITRPIISTLTLTSDSFKRWTIKSATSPEVIGEAVLSSSITTFECQFFPFNPHSLKIEGNAELPHLAMRETNIKGIAEISKLKIEGKMDGKKETLIATAAAQTAILTQEDQDEKENGKIDATITIKQFLKADSFSFASADMGAHVQAKDFPVFLLDAFSRQDGSIVTLVGPKIDINFKGTYTPQKEPKSTIDFKIDGEGLKADFGFSMDGTLKVLQDHPGYIHWTLTPARYHTLMFMLRGEERFPRSDYILLNSSPVSLTISELTCPAKLPSSSIGKFLCQSGFIGTIQVGPMTLVNQVSRDHLSIQGMSASIRGENFSQKIAIQASTDFRSKNDPAGVVRFQGELYNMWTQEGKWNKEGFTIKGDLDIDKLPVSPMLSLLSFSQKREKEVSALLGDKINAKIFGQISGFSGPIEIQIDASNFKASAPLSLQNGNLILRDTFKSEITLTQEVSETFLVDLYPLLIEAARSDHPLRLFIEKEGFMIPLRPFSFTDVKVGSAVFDIGEIWVKNGGQLQALMDFLKAKNISPEGVMSAWFTPIFMNLENGIATYKRFDALLAGSVHIACWGQINHINDKVKMVLAISPSTLQQRLGIFGLTKSDMFQIKMRGTIDDVEMDWTSAYKRIGILIARTAGGPPGYIVGGLLELLSTNLGEEPTPPPTTSPFPWQTEEQKKNGAVPQESEVKSRGTSAFKKFFKFLIP